MSGELDCVVLVVANETLVGRRARGRGRAPRRAGPIRVRRRRSGERARRRATSSTATRAARPPDAGSSGRSRRSGTRVSPPTGGSSTTSPLSAVKDVLASEHVDEIIVSTHPEAKSGWLRKEPGRRDPAGRPAVGPSSTSSPTSRRAPASTCSSSRTRPCSGEPLLDRIRARAEQRAGELPDRLPAERPAATAEHPEAERRLRAALAALRSGASTCTADRPSGPVHRGDGGDPRRAVDEIIVSTFPASARGGCGATWSGGSARRPACRSSTSWSIRPRGGARMTRARRATARPRTITTGRRRRTAARASTRRPRDAPLHRLGGMLFGSFFTAYFFVRVVNPTRARDGPRRRTTSPSSWPASTRRSSSRRASRCTGRCSRSGADNRAGLQGRAWC